MTCLLPRSGLKLEATDLHRACKEHANDYLVAIEPKRYTADVELVLTAATTTHAS